VFYADEAAVMEEWRALRLRFSPDDTIYEANSDHVALADLFATCVPLLHVG